MSQINTQVFIFFLYLQNKGTIGAGMPPAQLAKRLK